MGFLYLPTYLGSPVNPQRKVMQKVSTLFLWLLFEGEAPQKGNGMDELPHIGEQIRVELKRQGRSNVWLAQQLSCNPRTISKIFHKRYIDTFQLWQISKALDYDFFQLYSKLL